MMTERHVCVVRIIEERYQRGGSYFIGKSLRVLKKLTTYDMLNDICSNIGIWDGIDTIINLDECGPGLYNMVVCNVSTDWETGCVDDWDYKLIPYEELK